MPRLLFEKTGSAVFVSHLDLMRLFQRAFKRAGLPLTHTRGFNPRPSVSIALPLSVGVQSHCELLDFELEGEAIPCDQITERLNRVLIPGVRVLSCYRDGRKLRDLSLLSSLLTLEYDRGVPGNTVERLKHLLSRDTLTVDKRSKNGTVQQDIIPLLRRVSIAQTDGNTVCISLLHCCQNPTLNPMQLCAAVEAYLPECRPDFTSCVRQEIFDTKETVFR